MPATMWQLIPVEYTDRTNNPMMSGSGTVPDASLVPGSGPACGIGVYRFTAARDFLLSNIHKEYQGLFLNYFFRLMMLLM